MWGGVFADRFDTRKALAVLFSISSVACITTIILNNLVGEWGALSTFSWPTRTFLHVSLVFILPSVLLGTISPIVAKMALDQGLATGKTVGKVYAWGAAGSIAGTFLAGYYLIDLMGTIAIVWTVSGGLLLMGILYWIRYWFVHMCLLLFLCALSMGMAPWDWARDSGTALALREKDDPKIIYKDETQYCYVAVKRISDEPDHRAFMQDKLKHSEVIMGDISNLQFYCLIQPRYQDLTVRLLYICPAPELVYLRGKVYPQYLFVPWIEYAPHLN